MGLGSDGSSVGVPTYYSLGRHSGSRPTRGASRNPNEYEIHGIIVETLKEIYLLYKAP